MYAIAVHGGAGAWPRHAEQILNGVTQATEAGRNLLIAGSCALDAAIEAVRLLEDDPLFNAGTGACLNIDGMAELDAGVMDGASGQCGAVACLQRVRNPVLVARKVMEETDHLLLAGPGALRFARALGFADHDPVTAERLEQWRQAKADLRHRSGRLPQLLRRCPTLSSDTVGAVALDRQGRLAAATSTGGIALKMAGRVGDSPIPGAGYYASANGTACATGRGELMLCRLTAKAVCERMEAGVSAQVAVSGVLARMEAEKAREVGIIALDRSGGVGIGHLTRAMPTAFDGPQSGGLTVQLTA